MKILYTLAFAILTISLSAQSVLGTWKTIDDETGEAKAHVKIYKKDGKINGDIIKVLTDPDAVCDACEGTRKDQPIEGMNILWNLEKSSEEWDDGEILDPESGKIYSCKIWLENEDKLIVRGYLGFSLLGRSQEWHRIK